MSLALILGGILCCVIGAALFIAGLVFTTPYDPLTKYDDD